MENKYRKIILSLFIIASISVVLVISTIRIGIESRNNQVEIAIEYPEFEALARQSEETLDYWFTELESFGATSVAIYQPTLLEYMNKYNVSFEMVSKVTSQWGYEEQYPEVVVNELEKSQASDVLIVISEDTYYEQIVDTYKYYPEITYWVKQVDGVHFMIIKQEKEDVLYSEINEVYDGNKTVVNSTKYPYGTRALIVPTFYDKEQIDRIKTSGLKLFLRPINGKVNKANQFELYKSELDKYENKSHIVLVSGNEVFGYSRTDNDYIEMTQDLIENYDMKIGLVETVEQRQYFELDGANNLVSKISNDNFVRVFNMWSYIQKRYKYYNYEGAEEIGNALYRAITERNIRVVYFRPFLETENDYVVDIEEYDKMFSDLGDRIKEHGYTFGEATSLEDFSLPLPVKVLLTLQIAIYALILLNYVIKGIKLKYNVILFIFAFVGIMGAYYIAPNLAVSLTALGAAVIFSTLSVLFYLKKYIFVKKQKSIINIIGGFIISMLIALAGALHIGSIMADTAYFLELEVFRGIKLSLFIPLVLMVLILIYYYMEELAKKNKSTIKTEAISVIKRFLKMNIKMKYAVLVVVLAAAGYVYIARTGNATNLKPMAIEIMTRNFLENTLLARPRNKEFLFSFPSFIVGAYYASIFMKRDDIISKYAYATAFIITVGIGMTSITNTFSHIRTPLYLSLLRTGYSGLIGIIIGIMIVIVLKVFIKVIGYFYNKSLDTRGTL